MKKIFSYSVIITISFFTLNSCQEPTTVETIDSNLLVGEWQGLETWDSYEDNILHTATNDMYLKFTAEGSCTLYVENSAEDTIYYTWSYIPGNHKLFLTRTYRNLMDTTISNHHVSHYHDIESISNENLTIKRITGFSRQGVNYRSENYWDLTRIK